MHSLHGHHHLNIVVSDEERGGRPVHLIVARGEPLWPLLHYFQARNLSLSTEATYAHAIGLLIDFLAVKANDFSRLEDRSRLLNSFAHALLYGTIRDGEDPTGLWWHPRSTERVRRLLFIICEISDWLCDRYQTVAINPFHRTASIAEQISFWRRWNTGKASSLLKHIKKKVPSNSYLARDVAVPGRQPTVLETALSFPDGYIEKLLFEGFACSQRGVTTAASLRTNIRDILITLLLHFGGLRVSEPMHIWVDDVFIDPANRNAAKILVHHPSDGIYEYPNPVSGKLTRSTRAAYLQSKYGRRPLTELSGKTHAGWKNSLLTDRNRKAFEVFWFPQSVGELFLFLYRIYIQEIRPLSLNHPYLFVTKDGEPLGVGGFDKSHARAIKRIGLERAKGLGTSPHGHRHAYGQRLKDGGLSTKEIQVAMHHTSPLSQATYTQLSAVEIYESIKTATGKLAAVGFPHDSATWAPRFKDLYE